MMLRRNERILDNIPLGSLGIIALDGCTEMGNKVNDYIVKWRHEDGHAHKDDVVRMYASIHRTENSKVP